MVALIVMRHTKPNYPRPYKVCIHFSRFLKSHSLEHIENNLHVQTDSRMCRIHIIDKKFQEQIIMRNKYFMSFFRVRRVYFLYLLQNFSIWSSINNF